MSSNGTLVRTDLSRDEYAAIRKLAIDKDVPISALTGTMLRRGLRDADKQRRTKR